MNYHCLFLPAFGEGPLSDRRSASFRNRKREPRFSLEENALPESTTPSTTLNLTEPKVSSLGLVGDLMLVDGKSLEQPSPAPVSKEGNENEKSKEEEKEKEKETEQKTIGKELTNISSNNNNNNNNNTNNSSNNGERRESDEKWERFINPHILDDLDSTEALDSAFPQGDSKGAEERPDSQSGQQRTDSQLQRSDSQQQLQRTDSQQHLQRSDSQQSLSNFYAPPQSPVLYQMQQQPTQQATKQMPPQFSRQPQPSPQYSQQSEQQQQQQQQQPQSQQQYLPPHQQKASQMPLQGRPQEFYRQTHGLEDALQQRLAMESKQQQGGYYAMGGRQPPSQLTRMGSLSQLQGQPPSPMQSSLQQGRFDFTGGGVGGMPPSSPLSVASPLTVGSSQGPSPPGSQEGLVTSSQPSAGMGGTGGGYYAPRFSPISGQPPSPQQSQQTLPQQQAYKPSARPITSPAYPPRGSYPIAPKMPPDMEPLRKYGSGSTASPPSSMYPTVHNISATQPPPQQPRATQMTPNNPSASSMLPPQRPIQVRPPYPQQSVPSHFSGIPPSRSNMPSQAEIITLDDLDMPEQTTSPISATLSPLPQQQLHDGSQQPLPMSPSSSAHQIEQQWKMASQRRPGAPPPPSPVSASPPSRGGVLPQSSYQSGMPLVNNGKAMMPRQSSFPPSAPSPQSFTGTSATGVPHPPPPAYPSYSSPPSLSSYPQPYSKTLSGMEESQLDNYLHGDSSAVDLHPQAGPYGSYPQQPQQPLTPYSLQQQQQHQSFVQHKNLHIHQNFNVNVELPRRKRKASSNDPSTTTPATKVSPFFNLPPKKPSTQPPSQLPPGQHPLPGYPPSPYSAQQPQPQQHYPQQQPHSSGSFGV